MQQERKLIVAAASWPVYGINAGAIKTPPTALANAGQIKPAKSIVKRAPPNRRAAKKLKPGARKLKPGAKKLKPARRKLKPEPRRLKPFPLNRHRDASLPAHNAPPIVTGFQWLLRSDKLLPEWGTPQAHLN